MAKRKILCVTYPRSGHHMLVNMLLKYFSRDLAYPEIQENSEYRNKKQILHAGDFHYCEHYTHCGTVPCSDKITNFQKTHDFALNIPIIPKDFYIIQYRQPLESLVSYYKFKVKSKQLDDTKANWLQFVGHVPPRCFGFPSPAKMLGWMRGREALVSSNPLRYWKAFVGKWIINQTNPNLLAISYGSLINDSENILRKVIGFIDPQKVVNQNLIHTVCGNIVHAPTKICSFQYCDARLFSKIEEYLADEIRILNLDRYYPHSPVQQ